jgi:DNA-binding HxlR family transcriptional regulator
MRQAHHKQLPTCPAAAALTVFGDAWTLFIIDALSTGGRRFSELERSIQNICPVTLANRLKKLEQLGFIHREEGTLDKLSVVYFLTEKGSGMLPIIKKMRVYAERYLT